MDFKKLKRLISLVESSDISSLSIEEETLKIEIKKESSSQNQSVIKQTVPVESPSANVDSNKISDHDSGVAKKNDNLIEVKSPMVGTFYAAQNPDSPPFVSVGKKVKVGDVLCVVEAMKLFNDIESEASGTIESICVENNSPVEFGQVLFLIKPN